ncbi:MAG: hypothetical protein JWN32_2827 [Solirubrobacterales bacterium]|nr:hypothetical protein [Solirubrobacterales bacterium]
MNRIFGLAVATAALLVAVGGGAARAASLPTVTVTLTGNSIAVGGALESGAVNVTTTTTGEQSGSPTLIHLNPGVTPDQVFAVLSTPAAQDPNTAEPYGSIVYNADAMRGVSTAQTVLPAGEYVALDTGGNDPSKFPHTTFTVARSSAPAALPAASATLHAIEFGFKAPKTLHVGQVVRAQNDGWVVHMVDAIAVKNAKDQRKVAKLLLAGKDRQAQKLATGNASFLGVVSHGAVEQQTVTAKPGYYVLACFMDTQDGREHTRLGMVRPIRIVR